ncbi:MAG: TetR/AcrR family transcriptional regulator [Ruminiclostridium sp.]
MPPKPKFTREQVISTALEIAAEKGIESLTSRELGTALGSSARPIFTLFRNMEELNAEVRAAAIRLFEETAYKADDSLPPFKRVGMSMIRFAAEKPKLFRLLYMTENGEKTDFDDMFLYLGSMAQFCVETIERDYELDETQAKELFRHLWIFTYGVGALIATGACNFTEIEASHMLSREFLAYIKLMGGKMKVKAPADLTDEDIKDFTAEGEK